MMNDLVKDPKGLSDPEPHTIITPPTPVQPRRLQDMFNMDDSSNDDQEKPTLDQQQKAAKKPASNKIKSTVQFPPDLEQRFYLQYPKPPVEQADEHEKTPPSLPPTRKERLIKYLHVKFPSRIVRRVLKCTIAYFLSTLFSLIRPLTVALGPAPFLATTGMLFSHPGRSMGAQFDATVTAVMGVVAAILWAFAGMAASVAYNRDNPDTFVTQPVGRCVNALFLCLGVFCAQMLRQIFPKFHFFSLQFMIIQIFTMTRAIDYTHVPFELPLTYGVPLLIGCGISLVVNLVFWPETAIDGLGRALKETITSSRDMLHLITKQFFLDPQSEPVAESVVDEASAKMRKGMTKVKTAYREAKYEMSYAFIRPQQLGQIRKSLGRLTKHLSILGGCLKTERELFESAIDALHAEMRDLDNSEDDDNPATTATAASGSDYHSDNEDSSRNSLNRLYSEEDLNLLRTALRATNEFMNSKTSLSLHPSTNASPQHSRPGSRANSRPASVYNSEDDDDVEHNNQKSVTSLKSFLGLPKLSIPKPKPPKKTKKQTEYHHRHLLLTYLESLRDPLMDLSLDCSNALECVCDSIANELDMDRDDDISIRKTWKSFLRHTFKIGSKATDAEEDSRKTLERHKGSSKCNCSQNIRLAIIQFDKAERERMHALYEVNKTRIGCQALDLGMRQELFLVFFFIFTLREVANELQEMTLHMDELRLHSRKASFNGKKRKHFYFPVLNQKMWNKWARGNNHQSTRDKGGYTFATLTSYLPKDEPKKANVEDEYHLSKLQTNTSLSRSRSRRESSVVGLRKTGSKHSAGSNDMSSPLMARRKSSRLVQSSSRKRDDVRIDVEEHPVTDDAAEEEEEEEEKKKRERTDKAPVMLRIRYAIWLRLQYMSRYEFKFALKMAVAVLVLCVPAFVPASSGWYWSVRGQWAAMTVIAIMNPTSGGTVEASFWRIVGTLVGAFAGWAALAAGDGSPYLLAVFAVLLALPFFYVHLGSTYNKVGIVCLTTYMVVALSRYAYPPEGETIAATVCMVWPFVARHMVRKSIANCMDQLEDYYTFVMGVFLYHSPETAPADSDVVQGEKLESKIQSAIDACSVLLELTDHEPRFRGPFPKLFYKEMIVSMRNILDRLLSIRVALLQMPLVVKHDICDKEYRVERRDMIASMLLSFHTLASSLRSKTPLPVYMPSARAARKKLMEHRRRNKQKWVKFRNLTWFAMACSTEEIVEELEYLCHLIRYIVGETAHADLAKRIDDFTDDSPVSISTL
ncbi:hypothetical protein [Parasitella parasitica]|uniref:ER transporter 6TM N-terminal domain-containing protein n=1 Tax=Parasitella parasitica TaxID=35722 RepID=A0A0B7NEM8_9FUNG|nr:hypothetical protein [Parasitella parasitica]